MYSTYKVELTNSELKEIRDVLNERIANLERAVEASPFDQSLQDVLTNLRSAEAKIEAVLTKMEL